MAKIPSCPPFTTALHPAPCAGDTPLHQLVSYSFAGDEAVQALLHSARHLIHATNSEGCTPLMLATRCAYFRGMSHLLAAGASVNACDLEGRTSLHYAALLPQYAGEAVRVLCEEGRVSGAGQLDAQGRSPLHYACECGAYEAARQLLLRGAPVDGRTGDTAATPLHLAAAGGHASAARVLLSSGASRSAQCNRGLTPMATALLAGHRQLGEALAPALQAAGGGAGADALSTPRPTPPASRPPRGSGSSSSSSSGGGGGGGYPYYASPPMPPSSPPPPRRSSSGGSRRLAAAPSPVPPPPPGPPPRFASRASFTTEADDSASFTSAEEFEEQLPAAASIARAGWSHPPTAVQQPQQSDWQDLAQAQQYIELLEERVAELERQLRDPAALRRHLEDAEGRAAEEGSRGGEVGGALELQQAWEMGGQQAEGGAAGVPAATPLVHKVSLLAEEEGAGSEEEEVLAEGEGSSPSARTMSIWTTFFENAVRFKAERGEGGGGGGGGSGGSGGSAGNGGKPAATLSLLQAVSLGDLPAVEQLLLLGASCTQLVQCPTFLHPYPHIFPLEEGAGGAGVRVALEPCTGLALSALHLAAACGSLGALEQLGDAALMEREAGGGESGGGGGGGGGSSAREEAGALDGGDARGQWPLLISAALALHFAGVMPPSAEAALAAAAHAACAIHLLGSAADCSLARRSREGASLAMVRAGLLGLGERATAQSAELADKLSEYAVF